MKTKIFFSALLATAFILTANAQLKVMNTTGYVGIGGVTSPHNFLDVNGNMQISNASVPMGLMTENIGYYPILDFDVNFREPNKNTSYLGGAFRIDSRSGSNTPLFQWISRPSSSESIIMCLTQQGQLGIGKFPSYTLDVNGSTYCTYGYWSGSDSKLKQNIKIMDKSYINSLFKLNAVSYQFKPPQTANTKVGDSTKAGMNAAYFNKLQFGYIAEDLEKVFPNLVMTDSGGYKAVNYLALIPPIIEALKNQQSLIDSLKQLLNKKNQGSLKSAEIATTIENAGTLNQATLGQNAPNPFSIATTINYYLPETVSTATINIYDLTGVQIKSNLITSKGNGSITINANELRPGIFIYNLITDGQEVASKRMVLTQ